MDETGGTPGKDIIGAVKEKRYLRRIHRDIVILEFMTASRATLMAVINGDGEAGPPLFVFKGA